MADAALPAGPTPRPEASPARKTRRLALTRLGRPLFSGLGARLSASVVALLFLVLLGVNVYADVAIGRANLQEHEEEMIAIAWNVEETYESAVLQPGRDPAPVLLQLASRYRYRILILDPEGRVRSDTNGVSALVGRSLADLAEVASALAGRPMAAFHENAGFNAAFYAAVPFTLHDRIAGVVLISSPAADFLRDTAMLRSGLAMGSLVALAAAVLVTFRLSRGLAAPLERMAARAAAGVRDAAWDGSFERLAGPRATAEARRLALALDHMISRLRALEAARQRFLADAAHELRTPVANIRALIEPLLAKRGTAQPGPADDELILALEVECDRLARLAGDLLDLTELRTRPALRLGEVAGRELLLAVAEALSPVAREAGVTVAVEADPGARLVADAHELERALVNLVDNAIRHALPGSQVVARLTEGPRDWLFEVENRGEPIPPEALPHIFEPFYRLDSARGRRSGGSGLGLAIAREIALRHGGSLSAASEAGLTRFTLAVPKDVNIL